MLIKTTNIDSNVLSVEGLEESLSLWPFLNHLQKTLVEQEEGMLLPKIASTLLLEKIEQYGDLNVKNIDSYKDLLESLYHLAKGISTKKNLQWALGHPIPSKVFFGTDAFYDLIQKDFERIESTKSNNFLDIEFVNKQLYLLVLERFYHIPAISSRPRFAKKSGEFTHYYELDIDYSYVEIKPKTTLPKLNLTSIKNKDTLSDKDIAPVLQAFDISQFSFSGFTICTFVDCHEAYVSEKLQGLINNISIYKGIDGLDLLNDILSNIVTFEGVKTSFYPILKLNGIPVLSSDIAQNSMLLGNSVFYDKEIMLEGLMKFFDNPYILSFGVQEGIESEPSELKRSLQNTGLTSYICFPLLHNQVLVGIFELYTENEPRLNRNMVIQVRSFYSLLAQLANDIVLSFKNELNNVILHKYTSLQPAVEWKFNQVAAEYLSELIHLSPEPETEKIIFSRVYPFYAAVDVKDSSVLRNKSNREDILLRVNYVTTLIDKIKEKEIRVDNKSFYDRFNEVNSWISGPNLEHYVLEIMSFFQEDVPNFLDRLEKTEPMIKESLSQCRHRLQYSYKDMNSSNESFERSLQKINQLIKTEMHLFNEQVQEIFPSYFETFRTDGLEFDLYVGQSISPRNTFKISMLNQIRREQVISIAKIAQKTHELKDSLSIPLETTQLIFMHPDPIDISFREDERRFDVEGSYNIRYQIIKKRIDKALILNSAERLVQPGSIAIVYSRNQIARDIRACLQEVAALKLIDPHIEEVQLENLQGVSDLKAMRVKVKYNK